MSESGHLEIFIPMTEREVDNQQVTEKTDFFLHSVHTHLISRRVYILLLQLYSVMLE